MAYVYQHIRLDTNEVFYIGIGKNKCRAYSKSDRNKHWHHIVNKVGYSAQIIFEEITWEEAIVKEKELIEYYGRRDKGSGTLVNMTDGGEGIPGFKHSKESMSKIINSEGFKNRRLVQVCKGKTYEEFYGEEKAKEIKERQSKAERPEPRTGSNHHMFGKKRPEHSAKLKGKPNEKMKGILVGDKNPMRNKDVALKVSIAKTGISRPKLTCPYCGKVGGSGNMQRWHFENCRDKS